MAITDLPTTAPRVVPLPVGADLVCAEAVDVVLHGDLSEHVDVGPFDGTYLRFTAPDLVVAVMYARRLLDEIEAAVLDARQDQAEAERQQCPYCGTRLGPDETTCGASHCERYNAEDCA